MSARMVSRFGGVATGPSIEVDAIGKAFNADTHQNKVNVSVGANKNDDGEPWVLPVVRKVEQQMALDSSLNHEYLPILGLESFSVAAMKLVLGEDCVAIKEGRTTSVQTLSGTGALNLGARICHKLLGCNVFYYSNPSWDNHRTVFTAGGFKEPRQYRYVDVATRGLDLKSMLADLSAAPPNSVVILHACAHNPTGVDPTQEQWKQIADVMEAGHLVPVFDTAYQGFATGDLERDAWAVRYFASRGFEMMVAQSFAKNFGLYNERVGNLVMVFKESAVIAPVRSQITLIVRSSYSNPPNHGARIVSKVLNDPKLFEEWRQYILVMTARIKCMRVELKARLERLQTPGEWRHITSQIGMFYFSGLSATQVQTLREKHHVYLLSSGRINLGGVNPHNIDHVAGALHDVVLNP